MDAVTRAWFERATTTAADWPAETVLAAKAASGHTVSVVIPARNEERTVGSVVSRIRDELILAHPVVDELVVMDSLSTDATAAVARSYGARVHSVADVVPDLGVLPGKGEAMWKSLFVTSGSVVAFIDADLTEWGPHFVLGLLGPMLTDPGVLLVKGFYDRLMEDASGQSSSEGGRVTELVARPALSLWWPALSGLVQPLAGEWAVRRDLFERLPVPVGYGVEFASVVDTFHRFGLDAIAQVDLGRRGHQHQSVHDLGAMATEILEIAERRKPGVQPAGRDAVELSQFDRRRPGLWNGRVIEVRERPPAVTVALGDADTVAEGAAC